MLICLWQAVFGLFYVAVWASALAPDLPNNGDDDTPPTTRIIDVLSDNANFSKLLLSLQRSDLVDYVNGLENITFLAPLNSAFDPDQLYVRLDQESVLRYFIDKPVDSALVRGLELYYTLFLEDSVLKDGVQSPILLDNRDDLFLADNSIVVSEDHAGSVNSVVLGISSFLEPHVSLCEFFQSVEEADPVFEEYQTLATLFASNDFCSSHKLTNMTVLLPSDEALNLNEIELAYLNTEFGLQDKNALLSSFVLPQIIGGRLSPPVKTRNLHKRKVQVSSNGEGSYIVVDGTNSSFSNYLLSDGIVHLYDSVIFDDARPVFTPRKYLLGLNLESSVNEVDFRKLSDLIDDPELNQTIFVLPTTELAESKNTLLYHFSSEKLDLKESKLVDSKYCSNSVLGHCQKLKIITHGDQVLINHNVLVTSQKIEVGNTNIYFIDDNLSLPLPFETAVSPFLRCAKSLQFLKDFDFLHFKSNDGLGYTIFLPNADAWDTLDLVLDYLSENPETLREVIGNMIVNGLIYDDFEGQKTVTTILGEELILRRDGDIFINDTQAEISLELEVLFDKGVGHPIKTVVFPSSVQIGVQELLTTVDSEEFLKVLSLIGLDKLVNQGYSFIIPTSKSLQLGNFTVDRGSVQKLADFAKLHVLPPGSIQKMIDCEDTIPTMLDSANLTCRELTSGVSMLSIQGGNDHEVRLLRKGLSIDGSAGIVFVDRAIDPSWLDSSNGPIHLHLPFVAGLVGVIIGMFVLAAITSCCLVFSVGKQSSSSPTARSETTPLLQPHASLESHSQQPKSQSNDQFATYYSTHSSSQPINVEPSS
ncbi:hypothetical protein OGAPHI_000585 [Ogataea philodendri]|uniref:FAS1 domain-containing protein n=1 Tax=Ogataea philodendri TaxID=1378263 RepID=A0A9P8PGI7_9ASCO|nr:uncharacterized protein OGAPHI_000585 [Ogataea philodendri]KAH3670874.1 hypothetical protein OGAPHI_000585 [Ogataea philodendri]